MRHGINLTSSACWDLDLSPPESSQVISSGYWTFPVGELLGSDSIKFLYIVIKSSSKILSHLRHVARLPCKIFGIFELTMANGLFTPPCMLCYKQEQKSVPDSFWVFFSFRASAFCSLFLLWLASFASLIALSSSFSSDDTLLAWSASESDSIWAVGLLLATETAKEGLRPPQTTSNWACSRSNCFTYFAYN